MAKVAVAHWSVGAGHAARTLAVATRLRDAGHEVEMAGGGPGKMFVEMNGFDEFVPAEIDYTDRTQESVSALLGGVPLAVRRFLDYRGWLERVDADLLVTDDVYAEAAAVTRRQPFLALDHQDPARLASPVDRTFGRLHHGLAARFAEEFFVTSLVPVRGPGTAIGPVSQGGGEEVDPFDVLVIPGSFSEGFDEVAQRLREEGKDVVVVGGEDWEAVPSMHPYAAAADAVLCTGYSSIADAVVAGTPCIVWPFIDGQHAVADRLEEHGAGGVTVVRSVEEAMAALHDLPEAPEYENGADAIVERVERFVSGS